MLIFKFCLRPAVWLDRGNLFSSMGLLFIIRQVYLSALLSVWNEEIGKKICQFLVRFLKYPQVYRDLGKDVHDVASICTIKQFKEWFDIFSITLIQAKFCQYICCFTEFSHMLNINSIQGRFSKFKFIL